MTVSNTVTTAALLSQQTCLVLFANMYCLYFVRLGKCIFKANDPGNGAGQLDSKNACSVSSCTWKLLRGKACL